MPRQAQLGVPNKLSLSLHTKKLQVSLPPGIRDSLHFNKFQVSHPILPGSLYSSTACPACMVSQERQKNFKVIDRYWFSKCSFYILRRLAPDKVEEADEIASLEANLENNIDWMVILPDDLRRTQK